MSPPSTTHIMVIPYPAHGHMIALLDLTHHLATTNLFTITIVTTPKNLPLLSSLLSSHPSSISPLVLPFPSTPSIPFGAENTKDLPPMIFRDMMLALSQLEYPLRDWISSLCSPPVAIISDFFLGWTHRFATSLGIKHVVFSPSGAMALSVIYALWRGMPKQEDYQNGDVLFPDLPNCPKYPWCQLSTVFRSYKEGEEISEFIKDGFKGDIASWGLVVNSFDELECEYLGHLKSVLGHDRVWAVGPLVREEKVGPNECKSRGGSTSDDDDDVLSWLDTCRDDEVVYVSFGTQAILTSRQVEVVAEALEKSGVHFIWVVRGPTNTRHVEGDHGTVPDGFLDRVAGKGIVRDWAPQVSVLRHRAVGLFLTHCGWNSVLEAITAGVALLAWPMGADQFSNATLLVDYLKVGIRVCEGPKSVPDPIELTRVLVDSVSQGVCRQRMKQFQNNALEAVGENGSSSKELMSLVKSLTGLTTNA